MRHNHSIFCWMLIGLLFFIFESSAQGQTLIPKPQEMVIKSPAFRLNLSKGWSVVYDPSNDPKQKFALIAIELARDLAKKGIRINVQQAGAIQRFSRIIFVGSPRNSSSLARLCDKRDIRIDNLPYKQGDTRFEEGYILDVSGGNKPDEPAIIIAGQGPAGVFYGSRTLIQLLDSQGSLNGVRIVDYPDCQWRGVYLNFKHMNFFNISGRGAIKQAGQDNHIRDIIKAYADLKLNRLVFRGHIFHEMDAENLRFLKNLFDECRRYFIEPVPSIESKLENMPPYRGDPNKAADSLSHFEGVYTSREPFVVGNDRCLHPKQPSGNLIVNGSFEEDLDRDGFPDHWKFMAPQPTTGWERTKGQTGGDVHSGLNAVAVNTQAIARLGKQGNLRYRMHQSVEVIPNSYFELGFWGKGLRNSRIRIFILQYEKNGRYISNASYQRIIGLGKRWHKVYVPIFSAKTCSQIHIRFEPLPGGNEYNKIALDDVEMFRMNGRLVNALNSSESSIRIEAKDSSKVFEKNKDYVVKPSNFWVMPQQSISTLGSMKIELTQGSRLNKGDEVLLSYDSIMFDPREKHTKSCPSAAGTYAEYRRLFLNLLPLEPGYININMDEHRGGFNRDSRCLKRNLSNAELYALFISNLNDMIHKKGEVQILPGKTILGLNRPKLKLIVWDDMLNYWHNGGQQKGEYYQLRYGGQAGSTYLAMPQTPIQSDPQKGEARFHLPTDVIVAIWWYKPTDDLHKVKNSINFFESRGFDYFVCPWDDLKNIQTWSRKIYQRKSLGIMDTTFGGKMTGIKITANYAWCNITKQ